MTWKTPYPKSISAELISSWIKKYPTPFFVYDLDQIISRIEDILSFAHPSFSNFTPRYAIKANSNRTILTILNQHGIHFDASSEYEVERLLLYGIDPRKIMLTAQQKPNEKSFKKFINKGVLYNATSLHQLENYGKLFPSSLVSIRINPGIGSGNHKKTTVGGVDSGFGIWYEQIPEIHKIIKHYSLKVDRIHSHIGSGANPKVWEEVVNLTLNLLNQFPQVETINIGGGFSVARNPHEKTSDLKKISRVIKKQLLDFYQRTKRKINLEIEPGSYYIAESCLLIAQVDDIIETGRKQKNHFIKLNCGMNDLIRPTLYNSQHHIDIIPSIAKAKLKKFIVIGHCCESGDVFSITENTSSSNTRSFPIPEIGDPVVIHGCGAYGSSMSSRYNSFPFVAEFLYGKLKLTCIRKRESLEDMTQNELKNRINFS